MKHHTLLAGVICLLFASCNESKREPAYDASESIIQGLESSVALVQLNNLEVVRQTTDDALLGRLKGVVEKLALSPVAQQLVTRKAATVLYQKFGVADPRHAVAYTHLLPDDPSMADALREAATINKKLTVDAIEAKEMQVREVLKVTEDASDKEDGARLLEKLSSLKSGL